MIRKEPEIIEKLLVLFDYYKIPATWAVVGHLLETNCAFSGSVAHFDFPRPIIKNKNKDWFWQHPGQNSAENRLWFADRAMLHKIKNSEAGHEIGSHSYAHIIYGDKRANRDSVEYDILKARETHEKNGLNFESFVFPRNMAGYHELLQKNGIVCYRNEPKFWYSGFPGPLKRILHLADQFLPSAKTSLPYFGPSGLVSLDQSMLFFQRSGLRDIVPPKLVLKKITAGLSRAISKKEIFHFWFHPSNFSHRTDKQFEIFREFLLRASGLREKGELDILTMSQAAKNLIQNDG